MPGGMTRPIGVKPEGSKVDRMAAQSAKIEAGHVYLPKSAAWLGEFLTELLSFPNGRHDDQVDSVSQFLRWLQDADDGGRATQVYRGLRSGYGPALPARRDAVRGRGDRRAPAGCRAIQRNLADTPRP